MTMTTRDAFLAKIRAAQPAGRPRPDVPLFDTPPGDRLERFRTALAAMAASMAVPPLAKICAPACEAR